MKRKSLTLALMVGAALLFILPTAWAQKGTERAPAPPMNAQEQMQQHWKQVDDMLSHIDRMVARVTQLSQSMAHLTEQKPGQMVEQYRQMRDMDEAMQQTLDRMKQAVQRYENMMKNNVLLRTPQDQTDMTGLRDHLKNITNEMDSSLDILESLHKRLNKAETPTVGTAGEKNK